MRQRAPGTWSFTVPAGYDPATGKPRQRYRTFRGPKREAEKALAAFIAEVDQGPVIDAGRITVAKYLERWLEHEQTQIRPNTLSGYRRNLKRDVVPIIGRAPLAKLRPADVQRVVDAALARGLSRQSVVHVYRAIHAALGQAVRWQLVSANVASSIRPPRPERPKLQIPDASEVTKLLRAVEGTRHHAALLLAATTGMRRGEVVGLHWKEVDLEAGVVRVTTSLQRVGPDLVFTDPKTDRSRRTVVLTPIALDALRKHRAAQAERRLLVGEAWWDLGLVFDHGDGSPVQPSALSHALKRAATLAGLPGVRLHDLRHAVATMLLGQGTHPKIVSEMLGHSSIAITLDTYSHVLPSMGDVAAQAIQKAFASAIEVASPAV